MVVARGDYGWGRVVVDMCGQMMGRGLWPGVLLWLSLRQSGVSQNHVTWGQIV